MIFRFGMAFQLTQSNPQNFQIQTEQNTDKIQKKRVAIQLSYCGSGYYGLQYNYKTEEKLPTIEHTMVKYIPVPCTCTFVLKGTFVPEIVQVQVKV